MQFLNEAQNRYCQLFNLFFRSYSVFAINKMCIKHSIGQMVKGHISRSTQSEWAAALSLKFENETVTCLIRLVNYSNRNTIDRHSRSASGQRK